MKKNLLFLLGIALSVSILTNGCKKDDDNTSTPTNNNTNPTNGNGIFTDYGQGSFKVTGNGNYTFKDSIEQSGYICTFKHKNIGGLKKVEASSADLPNTWVPFFVSSYSSLKNGWYQSQDFIRSYGKTYWNYKIEANSEYEIIMTKLPNNSATTLSFPYTINDKGANIYGPFDISGNLSVNISCANTNSNVFIVSLVDAITGKEYLFDYYDLYNSFNMTTHQFATSIDETISKTGITSGKYYIMIEALGSTSYTVQLQ